MRLVFRTDRYTRDVENEVSAHNATTDQSPGCIQRSINPTIVTAGAALAFLAGCVAYDKWREGKRIQAVGAGFGVVAGVMCAAYGIFSECI